MHSFDRSVWFDKLNGGTKCVRKHEEDKQPDRGLPCTFYVWESMIPTQGLNLWGPNFSSTVRWLVFNLRAQAQQGPSEHPGVDPDHAHALVYSLYAGNRQLHFCLFFLIS